MSYARAGSRLSTSPNWSSTKESGFLTGSPAPRAVIVLSDPIRTAIAAIAPTRCIMIRSAMRAPPLSTPLEAGIENVAERVPEQVPSQHEQEDGDPGHDQGVPELERVARDPRDPVVGQADQLPPVGVPGRGAEPQERQRREGDHDAAQAERGQDEEGIDGVGDHVEGDDAEVAAPEGPGRLHVLDVPHAEELPAE